MNDNARRFSDIPIRTSSKAGTLPIRFTITLRIYSGAIPPNQVSAMLGIDATSAVGVEPLSEPLGTQIFRLGKLNGWFLESEEHVENRDPRNHIHWFLERVGSIQPKLAEFLKLPEVRAEISITIWQKDGGNLLLNPSDISGLSALGLPVWLSFADYGDDEEE